MARKKKKGGKTTKRKIPAMRETTLTDVIILALKNDIHLKMLYDANDPVLTSQQRIQEITRYLNLYWSCVKMTWPDIWRRSSKEQRLTHKAGLLAMTQLMPLVTKDIDMKKPDADARINERLEKIKGMPWDDKELLAVIDVGRKTEADMLYKAIQSVYTADEPQDEIVLRDRLGRLHPIKLRKDAS
ncbi:MAG: hypothetical protein KAW09_03520 [Thermoplasmata archaeon]|nr:hypothetical protein [Thermoplasmata archaeon]